MPAIQLDGRALAKKVRAQYRVRVDALAAERLLVEPSRQRSALEAT